MSRSTQRLITGLAVVTLALPLLYVALGMTVRDTLRGPTQEADDESLSLSCVTQRPRTIEDLNAWIDSARSIGGFAGADVGASVELGDGRSLWVFGDSIRSPSTPGPVLVHNSMLVVDQDCVSTVEQPEQGAVIPDAADGTGYWPVTVDRVAVPSGDRVAVGLFRVRSHGTGTWDFEVLGSAIAVFDVPAGGVPRLEAVVDVGDPARDDTPTWGVSVAVVRDWIYLYGTARPTPESTGWSLHVARTRLVDVTNPDRWSYWDGRRWSPKGASPAPVISAEHGVSRVLSVFEEGGQWYVVSKRDDFLGTDLVIWKGDSPHGPFVAGPAVRKIPSTPERLQYMALAHPHLLPEPGTVVVSWSRNGGDLAAIQADPTRYRPVFARVPLP